MLARLLATWLLHRHGYYVAHGYYIDTVIILKHGYCVEHDYPIEGCPSNNLLLLALLAAAQPPTACRLPPAARRVIGLARLLHRLGYWVSTVITLTRLFA